MLLIFVLFASLGMVFILVWASAFWSISYSDLRTVLTTTTATFGSLLGIITAGLMFTHGKFSELAGELSEKSPNYLTEASSLEKVQLIGTHLLALRKAFSQLEKDATLLEEKTLYRRITENASSIFVGFAVLLNLRLQQRGLTDTGFLVSEMDPQLYARYREDRENVRKDWQILATIKRILDLWEGSSVFSTKKTERHSLRSDLKSSISILELKERIDKSSKSIRAEVSKALADLTREIDRIGEQLHEDRVPQLLSQMEHSSTIRGRYFYLALVFIATPLLINLLVLPLLSESTAPIFKQMIAVTSSLSVMGIVFLLLYVNKILSV